MKRALLLTVCLLALGVAASAQDDAEYQTWMKSVAASAGNLRKNLDAKSGMSASADARKLADIFGQVHAYWEKKNATDAMQFAMDAQSGFKKVADLTATGKFDDAGEALKTAQGNCANCHNAHREKAADGSWKIK